MSLIALQHCGPMTNALQRCGTQTESNFTLLGLVGGAGLVTFQILWTIAKGT